MAQGKGEAHAGQDALSLQGTVDTPHSLRRDSADTPMHAGAHLWVVGGNPSVPRKPLQIGQSTHAADSGPS